MIHLFNIVVAAFHALAAWLGLVIYSASYQSLPIAQFRLWYAVLLVFFGSLVSLTYFKFFRRLPAWTVALIFVITAMSVNALIFRNWRDTLHAEFSVWDSIISYALLVVVVFANNFFMKKK